MYFVIKISKLNKGRQNFIVNLSGLIILKNLIHFSYISKEFSTHQIVNLPKLCLK